MRLSRFLQYAFIVIVTVTVGFSLYQWNASRASVKLNANQNSSLTAGLVGLWSFDGADLSGATVYDRSGSGNNGTISGAIITGGKLGQALSFDGVDDSVSLSSDPLASYAASTVCFWLKQAAIGSVVTNSYVTTYLNFYLNANNGLRFRESGAHVDFSYMVGGVAVGRATSDVLVANEWIHLCSTYDGSTFKVYGNAIQIDNASDSSGIFPSSNTIGAASTSSGLLPGNMDEVRVYNRALSVGEIQSLYSLGASDKVNTSQESSLTNSLTGYWKFDDGSGTSATDSSTNGNAGTLTSGPTWGTGHIGSSVTFDGTDDYVAFPASMNTLFTTASRSVSIWMKTTGASGTRYAFSAGNNSPNRYYMGTNGLTLYSVVGDGSGSMSSTALNAGQWYHVVVTYEGGVAKTYLNGALDSQANVTLSGTGEVNVGSYQDGSGNFFSGSVDEVRTYNRALSADEISQLYSLTTPTGVDTGLKGYWSFNGSDLSSTTAYDRSGAGNNGTLSGATIAEGKVGQALSFDGASSSVSVANSISATSGITLSAWVKPTGFPMTYDTIYLLGTQSNTVGFAWLAIQNDRTVFYNYASGTSAPSYNSTMKIPLNEWSHIMVTHDYSSQNIKIYIDGVLDTDAAGGPVVSISNKTAMIGRYLATFPFQGAIDEVRIYNRVLSAGEAQSFYDFGASDKVNSSASQKQGSGQLDSGLTGYWKFDDGSGVTATDSSTNGNNGTLTGSPLPTWGTGRIGSGLDFNGTNGSYVLGPANYTGFNNDYTISVWVKSTDITTTYKALVTTYNGFGATSEQFYFKKVGINQKVGFTSVGSATEYTYDITNGNWHHLVATRTISGVETVYADGIQIGQNVTTTGTLTMGFGNTTLRIGGSDVANMNGSLDEVRIYDRALSADEVSQLYRLTTPTGTDTSLKGYWSFNGTDLSSTTASDRSGAGNNGTLTSGPAVTEGKVGQALSFDGVDDLINMGSPASLDNITNFSYSAWVNVLGAPENARGRIFAKNISGGNDTGVSLEYDTGTFHGDVFKASVGFDTTDALATSQVVYNTTGAGNNYNGGWQYVVMTFDGASKTITLYLNGAEVSYQAHTSGVGTRDDDAAENFHIGNNVFGQRTFNGKIDEPRVYNRVLSAGEVSLLYNSGR